MLKVLQSVLLLTTALAANAATVKGVVLDPSGAVLQDAHVRLLDQTGNVLNQGTTDASGRFEFTPRAGTMTLVVVASGFDSFRKELEVLDSTAADIEVRLSLCHGEIQQIIPKKLDLRNFLVEIHHWGGFGCPERIYRLWGTGQASASYVDCNGKTSSVTRLVESSSLTTVLENLANSPSGPVCSYHPGGIDAARVELTIYSGNDPSLVISHDAGEKVPNVTAVEQRLEDLIDPTGVLRQRQNR